MDDDSWYPVFQEVGHKLVQAGIRQGYTYAVKKIILTTRDLTLSLRDKIRRTLRARAAAQSAEDNPINSSAPVIATNTIVVEPLELRTILWKYHLPAFMAHFIVSGTAVRDSSLTCDEYLKKAATALSSKLNLSIDHINLRFVDSTEGFYFAATDEVHNGDWLPDLMSSLPDRSIPDIGPPDRNYALGAYILGAALALGELVPADSNDFVRQLEMLPTQLPADHRWNLLWSALCYLRLPISNQQRVDPAADRSRLIAFNCLLDGLGLDLEGYKQNEWSTRLYNPEYNPPVDPDYRAFYNNCYRAVQELEIILK